MAFNKTEVRNKLRGILSQYYAMIDKGEIQAENYADFAEAMEELWLQSAELYQKDQNDQYIPLDAERYSNLIGAYGKALEKANKVMNQEDGNPALNTLAESLTDILYIDMNALENIVPGKNITLPEVIEKGRSVTVDFGKVQLAGAGNALSSRIPIQYKLPDGQMRKGFFTRKVNVPGREAADNALKNVEEQYPQFSSFFGALKKLDDKTFFDDIGWGPMHQLNALMSPSAPQPLARFFNVVFQPLDISAEEKNTLLNDHAFMQCVSDAMDAVVPISTAFNSYCNESQWLGGKPGERIDNRNSAMSMVSRMLGLPDLIAPAEPMTIIVDGQEIEGTFMENAYGKEVFGLDPNDPIHSYGVENYDNPAVFSQIADMQVVDFICGNIDRHEGNFFMQFDEEGPNAKLSKLTLIDNDLSFGKNSEQQGSRIGNKFVIPSEMGIIDKDTSLKVMALTRSTLSIGLKGFGLSDEQIDFAWQRTRSLQQQITVSLQKYENEPDGVLLKNIPRIVAKEDMSKYSLSDIALKNGKSQFKVFAGLRDIIRKNEKKEATDREVRASFKEEYHLREDVPKVKPSRLTGTAVKNEIFIQPELEPEVKPIETIDIEIPMEAQLGSVGGAMSSRKPVSFINENGIEQQGFFTGRSELALKKIETAAFREVSIKYPEFQDYIKLVQNAYSNRRDFSDILNEAFPGYSKSDIMALKKDQRFTEMMNDLSQSVGKGKGTANTYIKGMGASADSTIDMRNVGMTRIAELMGSGKLLAKSQPMRLKQGHRIVEGIFMEKANGLDYSHVHEGDPLTEYTEENYNNGSGLKALADIQVLDFICMNVDRHQGNMMYQFEEVDGVPKLVGVQGIDNDLSFFTKRAGVDEKVENASVLNDIQVISDKQAKFIRSVRPEDIEAALSGCRLSNKEIAATVERVDRLRERINGGQIRVLSDKEWDEMTLSQLGDGKKNIFSLVKRTMIGDGIKSFAKSRGPRPDGASGLKFTNGTLERFTDDFIKEQDELLDKELDDILEQRSQREMTEAEKIISDRIAVQADVEREHQKNLLAKDPFSAEGMDALRQSLAELDASHNKSNHFFGGSDEYTKAVNSYKELKTLLESASQRLAGADSIGKLEYYEEVQEQLQYATLMANGLDARTAASTSSNQRDRNAFARQLKNFSSGLREQIKAYNMASLENQKQIINQANARKAQPLEDYIEANFLETYDYKIESELLEKKISDGMRHLASSIKGGLDCSENRIKDLLSGYIVKKSIEEAVTNEGETAMQKFDGKIKNILAKARNNEYVKTLAEDIAENPEDFVEVITSGKLEDVYRDFKVNGGNIIEMVEQGEPRAEQEAELQHVVKEEPVEIREEPQHVPDVDYGHGVKVVNNNINNVNNVVEKPEPEVELQQVVKEEPVEIHEEPQPVVEEEHVEIQMEPQQSVMIGGRTMTRDAFVVGAVQGRLNDAQILEGIDQLDFTRIGKTEIRAWTMFVDFKLRNAQKSCLRNDLPEEMVAFGDLKRDFYQAISEKGINEEPILNDQMKNAVTKLYLAANSSKQLRNVFPGMNLTEKLTAGEYLRQIHDEKLSGKTIPLNDFTKQLNRLDSFGVKDMLKLAISAGTIADKKKFNAKLSGYFDEIAVVPKGNNIDIINSEHEPEEKTEAKITHIERTAKEKGSFNRKREKNNEQKNNAENNVKESKESKKTIEKQSALIK